MSFVFFFRKERNPAVKPVGILTAGPLFFQTKKYQLKTPCLSGNHLPASTKQESYFSTSKVKPSILKWRFITPSQRMKLSEIRLTTQHAWNHVQLMMGYFPYQLAGRISEPSTVYSTILFFKSLSPSCLAMTLPISQHGCWLFRWRRFWAWHYVNIWPRREPKKWVKVKTGRT